MQRLAIEPEQIRMQPHPVPSMGNSMTVRFPVTQSEDLDPLCGQNRRVGAEWPRMRRWCVSEFQSMGVAIQSYQKQPNEVSGVVQDPQGS